MMRKNRFTLVVLVMLLAAFLAVCAACQTSAVPEKAEFKTGELNFSLSYKNVSDGVELNYDGNSGDVEEGYAASDKVSVIISLGEGSLIESYLDMNPGVSVSEFISSAEGKAFSEELISGQNAVLAKMDELGLEYEFKHSLMSVANGFSVFMEYGEMQKLSEISGIEYCVADTFTVPELPASTAEATFVDNMGQLINNSSYTGKGTLIAIIDSGVDVWHEAFATEPEGQLVSYEFVDKVMSSMYASYNFGGYTAADVYYSGKIPFGFDYADGDNDPVPDIFSYYMGLGEKKKANEVFSMLVWLIIISSCIVAVIGFVFMPQIVELLGASDTIRSDAILYGRILILSEPFFMLQNSFQSFLTTAEKQNLGLLVSVLAGESEQC